VSRSRSGITARDGAASRIPPGTGEIEVDGHAGNPVHFQGQSAMIRSEVTMFQKKFPPLPADQSPSADGEPLKLSRVPSIVSADMTVRGELAGAGDLQVEGKVFGRVEVGHIVIAVGGLVEGDIVAKEISISGTFSGTMRAGSVALSSTARVQGEIVHEVLSIEAGAQIEGQCKRMASAPADKLLPAPDESQPDTPAIVAAAS
jgi:cytoskeletal protein CcmA (bactofilin family)